MWAIRGLAAGSLLMQAFGAVTWPSSYDELEDIMLLNQGYNSRGLSLPVTPCDFPGSPGHLPAAGFIRTAFHDIATHDAAAGTNGLDASIAFELTGDNGRENAGPAFNNTLSFLSRFYSTEASMSDLIALSLYTAVRGCGGPVVPIRTGRKDATAHGALGVPKPFDSGDTFKASFKRMGFNTEDMIKMVACGHTLGGVHPQQFPAVTGGDPSAGNPTAPPPTQNFDRTHAKFDNAIAVEFVDNSTQNPLVVGPPRFNSDKTIFEVDGGKVIKDLTDEKTFSDSCKDILQRMIDTVPRAVTLTEPIEVYDVKPGSLSLTLSKNGKTLVFAGEIRVRTTKRPHSSIGSVTLVYKDRTGVTGSIIATELAGTASGYDDSFSFYKFSASVLAKTGISSFDVVIVGTDGSTSNYNNNGKSFPVQDTAFVQRPECGLSEKPNSSGKHTVEVVVAVRGSASGVSLSVNLQSPRDVPFPLLSTSTVDCTKQATVGDFTYYKGTFSLNPSQIESATFDVSCSVSGKSFSHGFQKLAGFGTPAPPNYSTTTTTTTTKSTAAATTTKGPYTHSGNGTVTYSETTTTTTTTEPKTTEATTTSDSNDDDDDYITGTRGSPWKNWPTEKPSAPKRPCGEFEGCDANDWASETVWAIPTPTDSLAYTVPAGTCPGSATPTWAAGDSNTQWVSGTDGWHTVAAPTATGGKSGSTYTGAAAKSVQGVAGGLSGVAGVVLAVMML